MQYFLRGVSLKLSLDNFNKLKDFVDQFPSYDVGKLREDSLKDPHWLAFGAGNIFRGYIARVNQDLINKGLSNRGISVVESFDSEIIDHIYKPFDNLTLSVTLNKDGKFSTDLIANLVEGLVLSKDEERIEEIVKNKDLQIMSFTITEKGYNIFTPQGLVMDLAREDGLGNPEDSKHLMARAAYYLYLRFKAGKLPITMLSLDNCSHNGQKLKDSIMYFVRAWNENNKVEDDFVDFVDGGEFVSFPWTMIDKITPRPADEIRDYLVGKGFENMDAIVTDKRTYIAPFVNSEEAEYLVIEDDFKNGRDPLDKVGVYLTNRDTVNKVETMKVTTCLNPLHTCLAVYGCLLGYDSIAAEMKDQDLVSLIKKIGYDEALPVVVDPKILSPKAFIDEVIEVRLPNKYIPDAPQRIATDTSQKIPIRFGQTIKKYVEAGKVSELKFIPLAIAGWLRYLFGLDDNLQKFDLSADPLLSDLKKIYENMEIGNIDEASIRKLLKNETIFGLDLEKAGLADLIVEYLKELSMGKGAVRGTLKKYLG